jgi:hypothetical protein
LNGPLALHAWRHIWFHAVSQRIPFSTLLRQADSQESASRK